MTVSAILLVLWIGCSQAAQEDRSYVYRTVDALERVAEFLVLHGEDVTLDHALGAVIAMGQIDGVLERLQAAGRSGLRLQEIAVLDGRLRATRGHLDTVRNTVLATTNKQNVAAQILLPSLWRPRVQVVLNSSSGSSSSGRAAVPELGELAALELRELAALEPLAESHSARCIAAVLVEQEDRRLGPACRIPEHCLGGEGAAAGYTATHRLLLYHLAEQKGCGSPGRRLDLAGSIVRLCGGVLREAEDIARARFPPLLRDLFAEQVALCGLRGVAAFSRPEWLDALLGWQQPAGCFGDHAELQDAARPFRGLRDNARLDDRLGIKCVSHLTAVALAAAACNLRALVLAWLPDT